MNFENALVKRTVRALDEENVLVEEQWDLNHPECPFVLYDRQLNPFNSPGIRQISMSAVEYARMNPLLK